MPKLTKRYAKALLEYAESQNTEKMYRQAEQLVKNGVFEPESAPEEIGKFIALIPGGRAEVSAVLQEFLFLAREQLNLIHVEVISAVPLREEQLDRLKRKLIPLLTSKWINTVNAAELATAGGKRLDMSNTVDPSIIGGLRVVSGGFVLDDSLKRKLSSLESRIYKEVYLKQ